MADTMTRRWSLKAITAHGVLWYRATCSLSNARFTPLFVTRKEAAHYKRARCPGSSWVVARVEAKEW